MQISIDGQLVANHAAYPAEMNYGQLQRRSEDEQLGFELRISMNDFYDKTKELFLEFRTEMMEEEVDEQEKKDFPELFAYQNLNYPKLDFLFIDHPELFCELCIYMEQQLLQTLCNQSNENFKIEYTLIKVDKVVIRKGEITINGIAFKV